MTLQFNGTTGLTFNDGSSQATAASGFGFKNRIINGAMMIDQRNAGASVTPTSGAYTLDRWKYEASQASKFTVQQNAGSVTPPAGFTNYLGMTVASAVSVVATDYFIMQQLIEGFNVADLGWGTANAQPITVGFWVRSSLTGTFGGGAANSTYSRSYVFSYTINSANTWEYKTITIAGDTTETWLTTNGVGLYLRFSLGTGSTYSKAAGAWGAPTAWNATGATSVVGTSGATFYITGVQLEKGSTATSFDYRPYGTEEILCKRYYEKYTGVVYGFVFASDMGYRAWYSQFTVAKRASPTFGIISGGNATFTPTVTASGWSYQSGGYAAGSGYSIAGYTAEAEL